MIQGADGRRGRSRAGLLAGLAATLGACAPVHRAPRPEAHEAHAAPSEASVGRRTAASSPDLPPKAPWAPVRAEARALRAARTRGEPPRIPWELARLYAGKRTRLAFDVCVTADGMVDPEHTTQLDGPFDVGLSVKQALLRWRFEPRASAACAQLAFTLQSDGYCREEE